MVERRNRRRGCFRESKLHVQGQEAKNHGEFTELKEFQCNWIRYCLHSWEGTGEGGGSFQG